MRSIFEEDDSTAGRVDDSLTTRAEAESAVAQANQLALGGGAVSVRVHPLWQGSGDDRPYEITFANGRLVNAGVLLGALKNARLNNTIPVLQQAYSAMSGGGPAGIDWNCTESEYHAARNAAAAAGLTVMGGGTISQDVNDTEAIGRQSFGLPAIGAATKANYVIVFTPVNPDSECPVCNAAFLAHMILAAGADGGKAFVAARSMPKGWRAS